MNIGIFSKFNMSGGSEFRCAEMCNGIVRHTRHDSFLLAEGDIPSRIKKILDPKVKLYKNVFVPEPKNLEKMYEMDALLIVNTDSKDFTSLDYWMGRSPRHGVTKFSIKKMKQMIFLFNFIVSPSRHLDSIYKYNKDLKIITANRKFFLEIGKQDRYENVRHIPRMQLNSPIDGALYAFPKTKSDKIRVGVHSKGLSNKWNKDWPKLIKMCNERFGEKIFFDFMGMPKDLAKKVRGVDNVKVRKEDEIPVSEYLSGIDIYCFFLDFKREEPWARCTAEAMVSGCPVLATPRGGNPDQITEGCNGFLCKDTNSFFQKIVYLVEHEKLINIMSGNAKFSSRDFVTQKVIEKFINYL